MAEELETNLTKLRKLNESLHSQGVFLKQIEDFKNGHWTLDMPTIPGTYRCRARHTKTGDTKIVVYALEGKIHSTLPWGGYWWSVPEPEMPLTPDFLPEEE